MHLRIFVTKKRALVKSVVDIVVVSLLFLNLMKYAYMN